MGERDRRERTEKLHERYEQTEGRMLDAVDDLLKRARRVASQETNPDAAKIAGRFVDIARRLYVTAGTTQTGT